MTEFIDTIPQIPLEYYNKPVEKDKKKSVIDNFLDKDVGLEIDTFIISTILFVSLGTINIPFSFFYTTLFINSISYKYTHYEIYHNFMLGSIFIFGYFILLIMSLYVINNTGGLNLHPNSSERPYFYFI